MNKILKFLLRSKVVRVIYWFVITVVVCGIFLCSCNQLLTQSYQRVLSVVKEDNVNDFGSEIHSIGTGFFINKEDTFKPEEVLEMEPCRALQDGYNGTITYRWAVKTCDANDVCQVGIIVLSGDYLEIYWLGQEELMGDLNVDGQVNFKDLAILTKNWLRK